MQVSNNLDFHKRMAKKFFKHWRDCVPECQFMRNLGLLIDNPDFSFTLMNAQHVYAKMQGFVCWKELKDYCKEAKDEKA